MLAGAEDITIVGGFDFVDEDAAFVDFGGVVEDFGGETELFEHFERNDGAGIDAGATEKFMGAAVKTPVEPFGTFAVGFGRLLAFV